MPGLKPTISEDSMMSGFSKTIASEKNERTARSFLQVILTFQKSLDQVIKTLLGQQAEGMDIDQELFAKMAQVKAEYEKVLSGFFKLDSDTQRHALIIYADAVQDLIAYMHKKAQA